LIIRLRAGRPRATAAAPRSLGVSRQKRRNFDADKTVGAVRRIEYRAQHVDGVANIFDRELFENLPGRGVMHFQHALDRVVVFVCVTNGVLKNRRVTPRRPSSSTSFFSRPSAMKPRERKPSQTAWPWFCNSLSGFIAKLVS
jgi:hypothetical protein